MSFVFASMEAESQLKPPSFDGLEEHWQEWSFVMRAVLCGQHGRSQQLLVHAEVRGLVMALGDCSGRTTERHSRKNVSSQSHRPRPKSHLTACGKLGMARGPYDGCMFQRRSDQSKSRSTCGRLNSNGASR